MANISPISKSQFEQENKIIDLYRRISWNDFGKLVKSSISSSISNDKFLSNQRGVFEMISNQYFTGNTTEAKPIKIKFFSKPKLIATNSLHNFLLKLDPLYNELYLKNKNEQVLNKLKVAIKSNLGDNYSTDQLSNIIDRHTLQLDLGNQDYNDVISNCVKKDIEQKYQKPISRKLWQKGTKSKFLKPLLRFPGNAMHILKVKYKKFCNFHDQVQKLLKNDYTTTEISIGEGMQPTKKTIITTNIGSKFFIKSAYNGDMDIEKAKDDQLVLETIGNSNKANFKVANYITSISFGHNKPISIPKIKRLYNLLKRKSTFNDVIDQFVNDRISSDSKSKSYIPIQRNILATKISYGKTQDHILKGDKRSSTTVNLGKLTDVLISFYRAGLDKMDSAKKLLSKHDSKKFDYNVNFMNNLKNATGENYNEVSMPIYRLIGDKLNDYFNIKDKKGNFIFRAIIHPDYQGKNVIVKKTSQTETYTIIDPDNIRYGLIYDAKIARKNPSIGIKKSDVDDQLNHLHQKVFKMLTMEYATGIHNLRKNKESSPRSQDRRVNHLNFKQINSLAKIFFNKIGIQPDELYSKFNVSTYKQLVDDMAMRNAVMTKLNAALSVYQLARHNVIPGVDKNDHVIQNHPSQNYFKSIRTNLREAHDLVGILGDKAPHGETTDYRNLQNSIRTFYKQLTGKPTTTLFSQI